jgi:divalent metal cation (Fe/Co/Zn/Cd) transporter
MVDEFQSASQRRAPRPPRKDGDLGLYRLHFRSVLADTAMFLLRMPFLITGSMTLVSEAIRSLFTFSAPISAFCVLRAKRRGVLGHYDFGLDRIDSAVKLVAGLGLVLSGMWIAAGIADRLGDSQATASPLGLVCAAIVNAVNLTKNGILLAEMLRAKHHGSDTIHGAQLRARSAMVMSNLFLQITLTLAALARDAHLALLLDAAGAAFVTGAMFYYGVPMITRSLPVLLDAPASPRVASEIRKALAREVAADEILLIRTRLSERGPLAEIVLKAGKMVSSGGLAAISERIDAALRMSGERAEISVVLAPDDALGV